MIVSKAEIDFKAEKVWTRGTLVYGLEAIGLKVISNAGYVSLTETQFNFE